MCYLCSHEVNMKKRLMLVVAMAVGILDTAYANELKKMTLDSDNKNTADVTNNNLSDRLKSNGLIQMGVGQDPTNCVGGWRDKKDK